MLGSLVRRSARVLGLCLALLGRTLAAADDPADLEARLAGTKGAARVDLLLRLAQAQVLPAPGQAVKRAQEAYDEATALSLRLPAARALSARAAGYFHLGDLDRALESYRQGLKAGEALKDPGVVGSCLNGVAVVALRRGQVDLALETFERAITQLEAAGDRERLAGVANNVALIHYNRGEYDRALDLMSRALKLYEEIGDERGQGVVLNAIGNVRNRLGDPVRARETFERARAIAERTGYAGLQISSLVNIAEIQAGAKEWDLALGSYRQALDLARKAGSKDSVVVCLNDIGDVYRETGDVSAALANYQEAMAIAAEMDAKPRLVALHLNVGKLFLRSGRLQEAEASLRKAYDLADAVQERTLQKDAAEALVTVTEKRGDFRSAFEYQRTAEALKEKLFSRENLERVAALESRFVAERKERHRVLMIQQQEIQALEGKRRQLWIGAFATALVLLGAVIVLLVARNRLKERTNAELAAAYGRMEELARHDALTGLVNRRAATERLEEEIRRTERTRRPLTLLMLDVDDFKTVNDRWGHACGDAVLKGLGQQLRSTLREVDMACRWGGEEFLVILPETPREGALQIAEKIRRGIGEIRVLEEGREVSFTVTIGVGTFEERLPLDECLRRTDAALYEGKRAGKNRVVPA